VTFTYGNVQKWLLGLNWTEESAIEWQKFYYNASRLVGFGRSDNFASVEIPGPFAYQDLPPSECKRIIFGSASSQKSFMLLLVFSFILTLLLN
jgi:hypothetical protein